MSEKAYCNDCTHYGAWPINGYEEMPGCVYPDNCTTVDSSYAPGWRGMAPSAANPGNSCELFDSETPRMVTCFIAIFVVLPIIMTVTWFLLY